MTHRFHPWRRLRDLGPTWRLEWKDLPQDTYGLTDWRTRTITLATGMTFEERRSSITHEVTHVLRGPASSCRRMAEEVEVERISSRLLLPCMQEVADALVFHRGEHDRAAEDLWVDPLSLDVRLSSLYGIEREYLNRRLEDAVVLTME